MKKTLSEIARLMGEVPPIILTLLVLSVVGMNLLANKSINTGTVRARRRPCRWLP